jgi:hypothetical protein
VGVCGAWAICSAASTSPPGVWTIRSIGIPVGVMRIARRIASLSSMSMWRASSPKKSPSRDDG